jgi:hypothetical protein
MTRCPILVPAGNYRAQGQCLKPRKHVVLIDGRKFKVCSSHRMGKKLEIAK